MKIFISPYELKKKSSLNAADASSSEQGALIKVQDDNNNWGVADLKPWPSLGDLSLDEELRTSGSLFTRSLQLAAEDLEARKNKIRLLTNQSVKNNWLFTTFKDLESISSLSGSVKIKGDQQVLKLATHLDYLVGQFPITLRIDFNGVLSSKEFELFLSTLSAKVLEKIEYIEDPTSQVEAQWNSWNQIIPLAIDFARGNLLEFEKAWTYLIIKPARQDADQKISICRAQNKKFTMTSAMDHPVGVAHGLRWAQKYPQLSSGFLTLGLYEPSAFTNYFVTKENEISVSNRGLTEFGIGMTEALESQNWQSL